MADYPAGARRFGTRRPVGRCDVCGKLVYGGGVRYDGGKTLRHSDCYVPGPRFGDRVYPTD